MQRQRKTQHISPDGEKVTRGRDLDTKKKKDKVQEPEKHREKETNSFN